eukprot:6204354-Pleurochrysis_carterae.AAC.3
MPSYVCEGRDAIIDRVLIRVEHMDRLRIAYAVERGQAATQMPLHAPRYSARLILLHALDSFCGEATWQRLAASHDRAH